MHPEIKYKKTHSCVGGIADPGVAQNRTCASCEYVVSKSSSSNMTGGTAIRSVSAGHRVASA
eukprot:1889385-Rhodomonas_salina.2